ncbi:MAG TPA: D-alanyl-D-alanine carboxypeptidase [Saprospiraceae bacterium]|nr:D-alanyl-D-alanine carboxypeptidase [Saprospiraceae bacterium]
MKTRRSVFMLLSFCLVLISCNTSKQTIQAQENSLQKVWAKLDLFSKHHTGLSIYDLEKGSWVFNYRDDNYFVPASCTKILTMYATLRYMDEQIPAAYYKYKGDTILVWGGGDPGTFYPDINEQSPFIDFLKSTEKSILFSNAQFNTTRYGKGWAWDDFPFSYQCERTAFPIYGNRLWVDRNYDTISITPKYFNQVISVKPDTSESKGRNDWGNMYFYNFDSLIPEAHVTIPISFFENDTKLIWSEALGKNILWNDLPLIGNALQVKGSSRDSLIKLMMQESDNFVSEQLLLACSMDQLRHMSEHDIIDKLLTGPMKDIPDTIRWVDGSGLSRYNLMTPRSLIWVMRQIIKQKGLSYVKSMFPAAGQSGTLKADYAGKNGQPYIFAKSGTLRNTYCLTGILVPKSGHVLIFSWMNNDFYGDNTSLKLSMEHLFTFLRDNY